MRNIIMNTIQRRTSGSRQYTQDKRIRKKKKKTVSFHAVVLSLDVYEFTNRFFLSKRSVATTHMTRTYRKLNGTNINVNVCFGRESRHTHTHIFTFERKKLISENKMYKKTANERKEEEEGNDDDEESHIRRKITITSTKE